MGWLMDQARTFRATFKQEMLPNISRYGFVKKPLWDMQIRLIKEEHKEMINAFDELFADPENQNRREEAVKEMADAVFVIYQHAAAFNLDLDQALDLIYQSNLSKLDEHGKPIFRADGKVLKGPNYLPPDLSDCVPEVQLNYYDTHGK